VNGFALELLDAGRRERVEGVTSFVGEDASGSFGLLASHAPMLAILEPGLARFRRGDAPWQYIATPGAVVRFRDNLLSLSTRRYFLGADDEAILHSLQHQLDEEADLHLAIDNLRQMEQDMLKRLWELQRHGGMP